MVSPLSSQDENAAFLEACTYRRTPEQEQRVWESLGLRGDSSSARNPQFPYAKYTELHEEIKQIAESFRSSYSGDLEQLKSDLAQETIFSEEVSALGKQYGAKIWGRLEDGEIRSSAQSQGRGIEEYDWDVKGDRERILFYIRCWIISVVVMEFPPLPRSFTGKRRSQRNETPEKKYSKNGDEHLSDDSASSDAAEVPRMLRSPGPHTEVTLGTRGKGPSFNASARADTTVEGKRDEKTTSTKRKAQGVHERMPSGKQPKPSRGERDIPVHLREQRQDANPLLRSPTAPLNLGHSLFGKKRQSKSMHERDPAYMPREATAETETVVDGEEVSPREVDSVIQSAIALASEDSMAYEYQNHSIAGPSGTYRNPFRQDSVIPTDTQTQTNTVAVKTGPNEGQAVLGKNVSGGALSHAITPSLILHKSGSESWQQREYRHEICKLLIAYLIGIPPFSSESYDIEAEERMNQLLNELWVNDSEALLTTAGDNAARLQIALESWMSMRHRLSEFRSVTGYFGRPGEQWQEYLRGMDDVPRAQAMIAYVDLQGLVGRAGERRYVTDTFDDDLATVFYILTNVDGLIGRETFNGIRKYNAALLEWFRDAGL